MYTTHCRRYFRLGGEERETDRRGEIHRHREREKETKGAAAADGAIKRAHHTTSASNRVTLSSGFAILLCS